MENHPFSWKNPLLMVIFNSYVKLPEGIYFYVYFILSCCTAAMMDMLARNYKKLIPKNIPQLWMLLPSSSKLDSAEAPTAPWESNRLSRY